MTETAPALPPTWAPSRRGRLARLVANGLTQAALAVAVALCGRAIVIAGQAPAVWPPLAGLVACLLALAWLRHLEVVSAEVLAQDYIAQVRLELFDTLVSLPMARQRHRSRGGVLMRFTGDAQALRAWVGRGIAQSIAGACAVVALTGGLTLLDPWLGGLALLWTLGAAAALLFTLPPLMRSAREARRNQALIAGNMHDRIATLPLMQSAGQAVRERKRLERQNLRLAQAMVLQARAQGRHRLVLDALLAGLAGSVVAWLALGGSGALGGTGLGTVVGALGLIGLLAAPLRRVGRALASRALAQVARERIVEFMADRHALPQPDPQAEVAARPALRFEGVHIAGRLGPLDAEVSHGRRVALRGAAGSGKSALIGTAARLLPLSEGRVLLGGVSLERLSWAQLRRHVAYLGPDLAPLRGSVRRNLTYRSKGTDEASVRWACELAGWPPAAAMADQRRLPDAGATLSGDERRALALTRALVGGPTLLLIDEIEHCLPAPGLDSFKRLLDGFDGTLVFSTAEPAWAALADETWTLTQGVLVSDCGGLRLVGRATGTQA